MKSTIATIVVALSFVVVSPASSADAHESGKRTETVYGKIKMNKTSKFICKGNTFDSAPSGRLCKTNKWQ